MGLLCLSETDLLTKKQWVVAQALWSSNEQKDPLNFNYKMQQEKYLTKLYKTILL